MNCVAVRDRLPEHALGSLVPRDAVAIEHHLQWCAACRKEARELQHSSATLVYSVAPAEPSADLGDRVVRAVGEAARGRATSGRRGRFGVALLVAAALSVSGLGWGAVMAGRASRFQDQAHAAQQTQADEIERFLHVLRGSGSDFSDGRNRVFLGQLSPAAGETGGGNALTLVSPSIIDMAIVLVTGLTPGPNERLPFTVTLSGTGKHELMVGRIRSLDTGGGAKIANNFDLDLTGYDHVIVRDADGRVVLSGNVTTSASLATPSP